MDTSKKTVDFNKNGPRQFVSALCKLHGKPSAWRVAVFQLLKGYRNPENRAWPSITTMAEDLGCSKNTVSRCINDLIEIGAIIEVSFDDRSPNQAKLPNAKKVWQLTGGATINGEFYWYWQSVIFPLTGKMELGQFPTESDFNFPLSGNKERLKEESLKESVPTSENGVRDDGRQADLPVEEKPKTEPKPAWFDDYLMAQDLEGRIASLKNLKHPDLPEDRPKTSYKKTPAYRHLEHLVKHVGEYKQGDGVLLGRVLRWLWLDAQGRSGKHANYDDVLTFWGWIHRQGFTIKDVAKIKATWWPKWLQENPTVDSLVKQTAPTPPPSGKVISTPFGDVVVSEDAA